MIKILVVDIMVKLGAFLCTTAIKISGQGYLNIEVASIEYSLMFEPYTSPKPILKYLILAVFIGAFVWIGLELALSMGLLEGCPNYQMENNIF